MPKANLYDHKGIEEHVHAEQCHMGQHGGQKRLDHFSGKRVLNGSCIIRIASCAPCVDTVDNHTSNHWINSISWKQRAIEMYVHKIWRICSVRTFATLSCQVSKQRNQNILAYSKHPGPNQVFGANALQAYCKLTIRLKQAW